MPYLKLLLFAINAEKKKFKTLNAEQMKKNHFASFEF